MVAGDPGAVSAGGSAPFLARVLLEEVTHAARCVAGPQAFPVRSGEKGDGGLREHGHDLRLASYTLVAYDG